MSSNRERDAWEAAESFLGHLSVQAENSEDQYFGSALPFSSVTLRSVRVPPSPSTASQKTILASSSYSSDPDAKGEEEEPSAPIPAPVENVPVSATLRLRIPRSFNNRAGNLHGGAAATIFDNLNSVAVFAWALACAPTEELSSRWVTTGVSRVLTVNYLRPVAVGEEVDVLNEVVSVGRNLVMIRGEMRRVRDGKIVCTSEHHKVSTSPPEKL